MKDQMRMILLLLQKIEEGKLSEEKTLRIYQFLFAKRKEEDVPSQYKRGNHLS